MPLRVLIVPDKFKGTLTATEAAEAIAQGWRQSRPRDELELIPMSDGGDGFGDVMRQLMRAIPVTVRTVDAAHRSCDATWWWQEETSTALVETARVIGLAQLPKGKYHPFELDSRGLAAVFLDAHKRGAQSCLMGIGGSATNDGGFGLACALGWEFRGADGALLECWTDLPRLAEVRPAAKRRLFAKPVVAVDVQNPLLGPEGCTRIYGPQKGIRPEDYELAERSLARLAEVLARDTQLGCAQEPGAGAAGGLGYGLRCFLGAELVSGFDLFAERAQLVERIRRAQLVISGEGAIDRSTLMGKGVGGVARLCGELGVPCIGLAGVVTDPAEARKIFAATHAMAPDFVPAEEAMREPGPCLRRLAAKVAAAWPN